MVLLRSDRELVLQQIIAAGPLASDSVTGSGGLMDRLDQLAAAQFSGGLEQGNNTDSLTVEERLLIAELEQLVLATDDLDAIKAWLSHRLETLPDELEEDGALARNIDRLLQAARERAGSSETQSDLQAAHSAATGALKLGPSDSWAELLASIGTPERIIELIAAYGMHPALADAETPDEKRAVATLLVRGNVDRDGNGRLEAREIAPADRLDFLNATGRYAGGTLGGLTLVRLDSDGARGPETPSVKSAEFVFESEIELLRGADRSDAPTPSAETGEVAAISNGSSATPLPLETNPSSGDAAAATTDGPAVDARLQFAKLGLDGRAEPDGDGRLISSDTGMDALFLVGSAEADVLTGGAGNDTIQGGAGNDRISGGAGNDSIKGEAGNDLIAGDAGNDAIDGGAGDDTIQGGEGDDGIKGEAGNDLIAGDAGIDAIDGGAGDDTIQGGEGDDIVAGGAGSDVLDGGGGNDTIDGDQYTVAGIDTAADPLENVPIALPEQSVAPEPAATENGDDSRGQDVDTVKYSGRHSEYEVSIAEAVTTVAHRQLDSAGGIIADSVGCDGIDRLTRVERLQFSDEVLVLTRINGDTFVWQVSAALAAAIVEQSAEAQSDTGSGNGGDPEGFREGAPESSLVEQLAAADLREDLSWLFDEVDVDRFDFVNLSGDTALATALQDIDSSGNGSSDVAVIDVSGIEWLVGTSGDMFIFDDTPMPTSFAIDDTDMTADAVMTTIGLSDQYIGDYHVELVGVYDIIPSEYTV